MILYTIICSKQHKYDLVNKKILIISNTDSKNSKIGISVKIPVNGNYDGYIAGSSVEVIEFLICPTDAIDIKKFEIDNQRCVECLLCPYLSNIIKFEDRNSFQIFLNFIKKDKKFLTKWIGYSVTVSNSNVKCALEVKVPGGNRAKRIPLLLNIKKKYAILKVVDSFKDIEYGILSLEETEKLILSNNHPAPTKIIVPNESKINMDTKLQQAISDLEQIHNVHIVFIDTIWDAMKNGITQKQINWEKIFFETRSK